MRSAVVVAVLSLVLLAGPAAAQTPAPAPVSPTSPAQPAPSPQPPRPFPEGSKVAYLNVQRVASESAEGKASTAKVQALNEQKVAELAKKNQALADVQKKLQQSGSVLSDAARVQLERDVERLQVEIQRFTQDAQADVRDLQEELQGEFQKRLLPVISQVASEKGLHMIFSPDVLVWADPGLDITLDVIRRFDAGKPAAAAPTAAPAARPALAAPPH